MDSDCDDNAPVAGPSRISNSYNSPRASSSVLQSSPSVTLPNLGGTSTKVRPQKLRKEPSVIVSCYE